MSMHAKDPGTVADYSFDWTAWLTGGEAITSAQWSVDPAGSGAPTLSNPISAGARQGIHVAGGERGQRYRLTCTVETDAGRTATRGLTLYVTER